MALHAVDDISDAFQATKSFLLPFEFRTWLRLALLSLFVSSSGGSGASPPNTAQFSMDGGDVGQFNQWMGTNFGEMGAPGPNFWLVIAAIVLVIIAIALLFSWISAIFEFSFLRSVRDEEVHVRRYFGEFRGKGTRLFLFRLIFGLLLFALVAVGILAFIGPAVLGVDPSYLLLLLLLFPFLLIFGAIAAIIYVFTTAFVAPIMLVEDRGVISGWKRLWGVIKGNWVQFAVFILVGLFLSIGFGILTALVFAIGAFIIAIPFAIIFVIALAVGVNAFNVVLLVVLGIPLFFLMIALGAFVQVPIQTYYRYWALLILGDIDESLDYIPDQRSAVRE